LHGRQDCSKQTTSHVARRVSAHTSEWDVRQMRRHVPKAAVGHPLFDYLVGAGE